jgi:hypothetical protein
MHRHALWSLVVLLSVVLAGCGGAGRSDGTPLPPLTGTATPAELSTATRAETGFTETTRTTDRLNTTISATIQGDVELRTTRDVSVTTASVAYRRDGSGPSAAFGTYSVPAVEPFERADLVKNPAGGLSTAALATRAQRTYEVTETTEIGTGPVTLFGNETTATRAEATATREGEPVEVVVTVATVRHGGDYVTAVAVVPASEAESTPTATLFDGVTHG